MAFSKASLVIISEGFKSNSIKCSIAAPASLQSCFLLLEMASWLLLPGRLIPRASMAEAIVLAVYMPPHEPGPLTEISSILMSSSSEISPFAYSPVFSQTVT